MTDHLRRIRQHMAAETKALLLEAERARLFDHNGNRGSEAEQSILRWLRRRFAPGYSVSSGEIIDSFDTNAALDSRQQDGILHRDNAEANRFLLPSGMRLVPIEMVAAVVEVKLTLTKEEFLKADQAATETARLRYRTREVGSAIPDASMMTFSPVGAEAAKNGLPVNDPRLGHWRPTFSVFAFGGVAEVETIAEWLKTAQTISLVCCLDAGCVIRPYNPAAVTGAEHGLSFFAECLRGAIGRYESLENSVNPDFSKYGTLELLKYWDATGYEFPAVGYTPTDEERAARELLYQRRPSLRPKT